MTICDKLAPCIKHKLSSSGIAKDLDRREAIKQECSNSINQHHFGRSIHKICQKTKTSGNNSRKVFFSV